MIPRYQTVLFIILLAVSTIMGVVLWQLRDRAHERLLASEQSTPTQAPAVAPTLPATLLVAHDADNTLLAQTESLPLPDDPGSRARLILGKLLDLYASTGSSHPVPGGAASIAQVFFLPIPAQTSTETQERSAQREAPKAQEHGAQREVPKQAEQSGPQLAVVNLTASFAASHPSGLEAETLTIESLVATLHANFPAVAQVRFLVDGQTRPTLAGHADLTRTYLAASSVPTAGIHPASNSGSN